MRSCLAFLGPKPCTHPHYDTAYPHQPGGAVGPPCFIMGLIREFAIGARACTYLTCSLEVKEVPLHWGSMQSPMWHLQLDYDGYLVAIWAC